MKKSLILIFSFLSFTFIAIAQEKTTLDENNPKDSLVIPEGYTLKDTIILKASPRLDSTFYKKDIFSLLPKKENGANCNVFIFQSENIKNNFNSIIVNNAKRPLKGYRIRLFSDNTRSARTKALKIREQFDLAFPQINSYIIYESPFFRVLVGDFRNKSEAARALKDIKKDFPNAFIVKEQIEYPLLDAEKTHIADTVKLLIPIK